MSHDTSKTAVTTGKLCLGVQEILFNHLALELSDVILISNDLAAFNEFMPPFFPSLVSLLLCTAQCVFGGELVHRQFKPLMAE